MSDFDFSSAEVGGKLLTVKLEMLPGSIEVDLEFLGDENESWLADRILRANAEKKTVATGGKQKLSKRALEEANDRVREILAKHCVRNLRGTYKDGSKAGNEGIPKFCAKVPQDIADMLIFMCRDANNWRDAPEADPKELAEKS